MQKSRHIPKDVVEQFLQEARGRCCLCREPIEVASDRHELLADVLEKHHIIYFSDGGDHTVENLLLACPNCHRLVHKFPHRYPMDSLREQKRKWDSLAREVECKQLYSGLVTIDDNRISLVETRFSMLSFGLRYEVIVPDAVTVGQYTQFVVDQIVRPLGVSDGDPHIANPSVVALSLKSDTEMRFDFSQNMKAVLDDHNDPEFVVHIHRPSVAAPVDPDRRRPKTPDWLQGETDALLQVCPDSPAEGQGYHVIFKPTEEMLDEPAKIDVHGTDHYHFEQVIECFSPRIEFSIPGAGPGIRDTIILRGSFMPLQLELVFADTRSRHTAIEFHKHE